MQLQADILKGYIAISCFIQAIQGCVFLFMGLNRMILLSAELSWLNEFFGIDGLKANLVAIGLLAILFGLLGIGGVLHSKKKMLLAYNLGTLTLVTYCLILLVPMINDDEHGLQSCSSNKQFQDYNKFILNYQQEAPICSAACPCSISSNIQLLYTQTQLNTLTQSPNGVTQALNCLPQNAQAATSSSEYYIGMARLENQYYCQGMCSVYPQPTFMFTQISRGPPLQSTCYDELKIELNFFYIKAISALCSLLIQLALGLVTITMQYKMFPKLNKNYENAPFYIRISQL